MNERELVRIASGFAKPMSLATGEGSCASVASALVSASGKVYTGVCVDLRCGLGFCAERAAAEMMKHRETSIGMIVAVEAGGKSFRRAVRVVSFSVRSIR
jgi:cytidine deaminase